MAKITTFEAGYCTHPGCMALKGAGWRICRFPARSWLLEVGERRWLWDTGYASWFEHYTRNGIFRLYRRVTPVQFDPAESMARQLQSVGLAPGDLNALILSHFHADHIAGLRDFPGVPVIASGEGWQETRHLRGFAALRQGFIPGLIPEAFEAEMRAFEGFTLQTLPEELLPFTEGYALPDSNSEILLVPLPGHARGHIGAFVQTDSGWTLLASDAAWAPASYREMRGPSRMANLIMADPVAYYQTLAKLHQLWLGGRVRILLCHEGDL